MAPFRIIGNIYYVGASDVTSYLIKTPAGDILLDGGLPETAPMIEKNIATLGFHLKDVKYLLNSHAHFDHAGGLAELKRATGAKMLASRGDAPLLERGGHHDFAFGDQYPFASVKVDKVFDDGAVVSLGGATLTAHVTPGHTKGCTTWTMPVVEAGKTYNVVFFCSTSAPGYRLTGNPNYPNMVADYESSFARLRQLPCDVFLGAHGNFFHLKEKRQRLAKGGPNPFIQPGEFQAYLTHSQEDFERTLRQQRSEIHSQKPAASKSK